MTLNPWMRAARGALLALSMACGAMSFAQAANPSMLNDFNFDKPIFIHSVPFAQEKLVLQMSSGNPAQWHFVLNNAQNVLEHFGQDKVQIVVVAFGPGLKMLLKNSPVGKLIEAQDAEGIEFDACHNTMKAMAKELGHMPELVPQAVIVPAGVVRIMQLEKAGFAYIRP